MVIAAILTVIICLCCCIRFRIPRTKQEIEADYVRKKITRKFQKQLKMIQNSEMDEMDLKRALDRIRAEFKSDTESLAQSEGFSISSAAVSDDRRKSSAASVIGVSIEELIERRNSGFAARFASFVSILRPRKNTSVQQIKSKLKQET